MSCTRCGVARNATSAYQPVVRTSVLRFFSLMYSARAEYISEKNRRTDVRTTGWYALVAFRATPQRVQLMGRVQQFDPSNQVTTDRSTGYLLGVQYFIRGDDFKLLGDYEVFREQSVQLKNNRGVI